MPAERRATEQKLSTLKIRLGSAGRALVTVNCNPIRNGVARLPCRAAVVKA